MSSVAPRVHLSDAERRVVVTAGYSLSPHERRAEMGDGNRWSIPRPVLDALIGEVEKKFGDVSRFEYRFVCELLQQLRSALAAGQDPAKDAAKREEVLKKLGHQSIERSGLNTQLARAAQECGTWREFAVEGQVWWGRLRGPTGAARQEPGSDRLFFIPEVFPGSAVLGLTRGETDQPVGLESVNVQIGDAEDLTARWLFPLLPTATRIDLVNAYHVNEWVRDKLESFRNRESGLLRACFMDVLDEELLRVFRRKVYDRTEDVIKHRVGESIQKLLRCDPVDVRGRRPQIESPDHPPRATFSIYVTPQRLTYSYWRVDGRSIIVPLDVKLSQDPRPIAWALGSDITPRAFDYYATDIESLFEERYRVYTSNP